MFIGGFLWVDQLTQKIIKYFHKLVDKLFSILYIVKYGSNQGTATSKTYSKRAYYLVLDATPLGNPGIRQAINKQSVFWC
jgi:hypothetical protein